MSNISTAKQSIVAVSARDLNHTLNLETQSMDYCYNNISIGYFATFGNVQA